LIHQDVRIFKTIFGLIIPAQSFPKLKIVYLLSQTSFGMAAAIEKKLITEKEYLEDERNASYKSEFYRGEVFAMSGASRIHNVINVNLTSFLSTSLKGKGCRPYSNDMRLHIPLNTLYTYPDIVVTCGKEDFLDNQFDTLLNPVFIAEVLSPPTADYDLGKKFMLYRSIPSLKEFWAILSFEYRILKYVRNVIDNSWVLSETTDINASLVIESLSLTISVSEIYDEVSFG
jgi:Uma2 family endonuclease